MKSALLALAILFESRSLSFCNELVRKTTGPFLKNLLTFLCGGTWVLRHSSTEIGQYNIFFSDYDFSLIVETEETDPAIRRKIFRYERIKNLLRMLGEVEVYFEHEWELKKSIISKHKDLLYQVRDLRKIKWIQSSFRATQEPYHKAKALRSIRHCRNKIKARKSKIESSLNQILPFIDQEIPNFYSNFFQRQIDAKKSKDQLLMSLMSMDHFPFESQNDEIIKFRTPVIDFEYLEHLAFQRAKLMTMRPSVPWLNDLKSQMKYSKINFTD